MFRYMCTIVPSSRRTQCQFLKTNGYWEAVIYRSVAASSLTFIIYEMHNYTIFKTYRYTMAKAFLIVK